MAISSTRAYGSMKSMIHLCAGEAGLPKSELCRLVQFTLAKTSYSGSACVKCKRGVANRNVAGHEDNHSQNHPRSRRIEGNANGEAAIFSAEDSGG